jgi:drug/metabolite transporter (DMT)-like permease
MAHGARAMTGREWALLLLLSTLWGSSFLFYKLLVGVLPPATLVLGRVGLAAVALNLLLAARGESLHGGLPWGAFLVLGVLNNVVPFILFAWAEGRLSSGLAAILNAATPLFSVLLAHVVTQDERLTANRAVGVVVGFAGVVTLLGPDRLLQVGAGGGAGIAACLAAAFSYACAGLYGRRFGRLNLLQVAAGQITAATLVALPVAAVVDRFWSLPDPGLSGWAALGGIALFGTVLAYLLYFRILATAGATNVVLCTFLLPVSALLLGHFLLGEMVPARAFAGMALIGAGLAAIDGRAFAALGWLG